ncbi:MAG: extracellular solute-binding protein [Chloroflexi bacterium]|nr:extracellular solute-binding protein [Chloroflexota bacterium]
MKTMSIALALVLIAAIVLSACSGGPSSPPATKTPAQPVTRPEWSVKWDQWVEAAKKQDGKVILYGEVGPIFKTKVTQAFKEKYGIEVDSVAGKPPEVAQKFLTERGANLALADVLITGQTTTLTVLKPKGVLASPKPLLILPEILDAKVWPNGALPFLDKDERALALIGGYMRFIAVNTEMVKDGEISTYQDLLNPRWKGKITLYDPTIPGNGGTWLAFTMLKALGKDGGEKFLRQLATQDLAVTRDSRFHGETVARGKYAIGIGAAIQIVQDLAQAGAPLTWVKMKEGGLVLPGAFVAALPDRPAHPSATALMLNFLLTREGQQIASEAAGLPAMRQDLPASPALQEAMPKSGDKVYWLDEDFILTEPTFYPLAREILGMK